MKIETIETSRLFLRSFTKKDVDFAVSIWNDPDMGEYLSDPSLENMDDEYRAMLETLGEDPECCYLISESRNTGERTALPMTWPTASTRTTGERDMPPKWSRV